jgi:hypothetical protein
MSKLIEFIEKIATDPALQKSYAADPERALRDYGLDDAEIKAVLSGDRMQVEALTGRSVKPVLFYFFSD